MSSNDKAPLHFGNKYFEDVTNESTAKETFSLYEAIVYGETGMKITSNI